MRPHPGPSPKERGKKEQLGSQQNRNTSKHEFFKKKSAKKEFYDTGTTSATRA